MLELTFKVVMGSRNQNVSFLPRVKSGSGQLWVNISQIQVIFGYLTKIEFFLKGSVFLGIQNDHFLRDNSDVALLLHDESFILYYKIFTIFILKCNWYLKFCR